MDAPRTNGTYSLDELDDYKVAEGEPDPRGWDVYSSDTTQKLGEVKDLLVDLQTMTVRYLDVELDEELAGEDGRHVLLPVGTARLDEEGKDRVLVQTAAERVRAIPAYQRDGAVKRDYEDSLFTSMGLAGVGRTQTDYYGRPEFDTDRFYSSRRGRMDRDRSDTVAGELGNAEREVKDNTRSLGDRVADKVDDVKDSVDGNPASKWGRDATDRPAR